MAVKNELQVYEVIGLPSPGDVVTSELQGQYNLFLQQLRSGSSGDVVLSDPYFFQVETDGILDSVEAWIHKLNSEARTRLVLLSILTRPFDYSKVWPEDRPRFIDDPLVNLFFGAPTISLAEGTSGIPFGIDSLEERRRVLNDPSMKRLIDAVRPSAAIETLTSEFFGGQPGNYAYQAWQVSDWSSEWASVYGISDAAHPEGYPFPWFFGFCRKERLERNFIALMREGARHYDWGFYSTYGHVSGQWRLASMALSVGDDDEQPRWDLIDQLLGLDEDVLASVLEEEPEAPAAFLARISAILDGAVEAGFEEDVSLGNLLAEIEERKSLAGIEQKLPEWQSAYEVRVEKEQSERAEKLLPFQEELGSWASTAAGPRPRSMNAGIGWGIRRRYIQSYLEAYVLEHRALPTGRHNLGRTGTYSLNVGVIDFDDVARRAGDTNRDKPS